MQGTGIDCLISQPGLVKTELNGRKLDHRKLSAIGVDLATKVYGQDAEQAANCLIRPATDPTVEGKRCIRSCSADISLYRICPQNSVLMPSQIVLLRVLQKIQEDRIWLEKGLSSVDLEHSMISKGLLEESLTRYT